VAAALAIIAAITVADVILGGSVVLVGLLIAAVLLCGLRATPERTAVVGVLAVAIAGVAFVWNDNASSWTYWVPLSVVALGTAFGFLLATDRRRLRQETARMAVLAEVGNLAQGGRGVRETAQAVADAVVPAVADLCLIDTVDPGGTIRREAGAFTGDPALLRRFLDRPPSPGKATAGAAHAAASGQTVHVRHVTDAMREDHAHDQEDLALLGEMALGSAVLVPLVARSRTIGVLTLAARPPRSIDAGAARYAETLGGRVALALDNARLTSELTSTERQLDTILATVDAGIMVRDVAGRLVYANQAAADLLREPHAASLTAASAAELMGRFDVYDEEGRPVDLEELPGTRVLRGELHPPPVVVRNVVRATGEERWLLNKATPVLGPDGDVVMAVNLIEDVTETKRGELSERLLGEVARRTAESDDPETLLQGIAEAAVPGLADVVSVQLLDAVGSAVTVARAGAVDVAAAYATMAVPLIAGADALGELHFGTATARRFDERDLELARDLGRQAGLAVRNAQLRAERGRIADTLQAGLLPDQIPAVEGWQISAVYRAAGRLNEVGGDFYDVVPFAGGWTVMIGDVVGKGAEAATVTALARHTVATMIEATGDPAAALALLNRRLRRRADRLPTLVSIALLTVTQDDAITVYSAGHPLPLLRRDGTVRQIGRTSLLLGVEDEVTIACLEARALPGDRLLLYTDGVIDAVGHGGRFGEQRLVSTLESLEAAGADDVAREVLASIDAFAVGEQADDIAIISLVRDPALDARAPRAA
jgi:serine phosphatase RsbU (regulator of sigma subunit)/PAS domain-containing protein